MSNIVRKVKTHEFVVSNSWLATKSTFAKLECGHVEYIGAGHDASNLPSEMPCKSCGDIEVHRATLKNWIATGKVMYTRAKPDSRMNYDTTYTVYVYGRDEKSPTGVLLMGTVPDIPELKDLLTGSLSPLSPTEGLNKSGARC